MMPDYDEEYYRTLPDEALRELGFYMKDHAQQTQSVAWLYWGVIIGLASNIGTTAVDVFLESFLSQDNYFLVTSFLGLVALAIAFYYAIKWREQMIKLDNSLGKYNHELYFKEVQRRFAEHE